MRCLLPRFGIVLVAALLIAGLASGCRVKNSLPPIRIGVNPWPGYEFLFLAQAKGFFDQEGVAVQLVEFSSLGDNRRAFERGEVDGFAGTLVEMMIAQNRTRRLLKAYYVPDCSNGSDMLLSRAPIERIQDLKGKRIGLQPDSVDLVGVYSALLSEGIRFSDVQLISINQDDMAKALKEKRVEAVQTYPPFASLIMRSQTVNRLFDSSRIPGVIVDVLVADAELLKNRGGDFEKIIRAFWRAYRFSLRHPDEAHRVMAEREKITVQEFREGLSGVKMVEAREQMEYFQIGGKMEKAVQVTLDALLEMRMMERGSMVRDFIATEPVRRAFANGIPDD